MDQTLLYTKLCKETHLTPSAVLWVRNCYDPHFTGEETEAQGVTEPAQATQLVCGTAGVWVDSVVQEFVLLSITLYCLSESHKCTLVLQGQWGELFWSPFPKKNAAYSL